MDVSILICTRNRAELLRETLKSIAATTVPTSLEVELVIVDNGSSDHTRDVLAGAAPDELNPRLVAEPTPGLSHARNTGIAATEGRVLLFTDDDVRVPSSWIKPMATPLLEGRADAVAGGVQLTESMRRRWMSDLHASLLADTRALQRRREARLVGANMAIARSVFDTISGFDPELGAGDETFGFHEETLLTLQMKQAGYRIKTAYDVAIEHRPKPNRIHWEAYNRAAQQLGRSDAYLDHHWRHTDGQWVRSGIAYVVWSAVLGLLRPFFGRIGRGAEGMSQTELDLRRRVAYHRQMMKLVGTCRKYDQYGTRKRPTSGGSSRGRSEGSLAARARVDSGGASQ